MLDELCEDYGFERKYTIKLPGNKLPAPTGRRKSGRHPRYPEIEPIVRTIWKHAGQPCGKLLAPALKHWLPFFEKHHGKLSSKCRRLVLRASPATLDRLLQPARVQEPLWGRSATQPGFFEADTVAHRGGSLAGDFIWSVTYTDILSAWTEGRAVWNRGAEGVVKATQDAEASLPFAMKGFDCDNGGEFLNYHLLRCFSERPKAVQFTRSRPYHKDGNAHVEQKNWMWPRQLLGYQRREDPEQVDPIAPHETGKKDTVIVHGNGG